MLRAKGDTEEEMMNEVFEITELTEEQIKNGIFISADRIDKVVDYEGLIRVGVE